jgi:DNA invertase Pin-like site-specific DNA recombinase
MVATMNTTLRALGYVRVSTDGQVDSGAGLAAQRAALTAEADRRGWSLELVTEDGLSAKDLNRPALVEALARLDRHDADLLMVSKLDRLSRSVHDFSGLLDRAKRRGWALVCLDIGVDSSTVAGEFMANMIANAAQYERRLIGQRTSAAMQAKRQAGATFGRPDRVPAEVVARVVAERAAGRSLAAIAAGLDADEVPTAHKGRRWYPSTVAAMLRLAVPVAGVGLAGRAGAPPAFGGDQDRGESRSRERHAVMVKRSGPAGHAGVVM